MKVTRFLIVLICLIGVATFADNEKERDKKKTEIRQMSQQTLARLYKAEPSAKAAVQKAYGYAVFSNPYPIAFSRFLTAQSITWYSALEWHAHENSTQTQPWTGPCACFGNMAITPHLFKS